MYMLCAIAIGAVILAVYEKRKGIRLMDDGLSEVPHDRELSAYTKTERMRAEAHAKQMPTSGFGIF